MIRWYGAVRVVLKDHQWKMTVIIKLNFQNIGLIQQTIMVRALEQNLHFHGFTVECVDFS